ncbi:hypothetical protein BC833DRAFT_609363 [Globomyces pollinis-pini]|nr:hypothetical protein BC833DRAFT_609363 [Globomyces pollinis-pini]
MTDSCEILRQAWLQLNGNPILIPKVESCCDDKFDRIKCIEGNITEINWSDQSLSGSIPNHFNYFTNLTVLKLDNNGINGVIPTYLETMTSLTVIHLDRNNLEGSIPNLTKLNLTSLYLEYNNLNGLFINPKKDIQFHSLSDCKIQIGNFIKYDDDNIIPEGCGGNEMFYSVDAKSTDCVNLRTSWLEMNGNQMTAPDSRLCCLSGDSRIECRNGKITKIYWFRSELKGNISKELFNLQNLNTLALEENSLTGVVPDDISLLTELEYLNLESNLLTGDIGNMYQLKKLKYLFLDYNDFTGVFRNPNADPGFQILVQCEIYNQNFLKFDEENSIPLACGGNEYFYAEDTAEKDCQVMSKLWKEMNGSDKIAPDIDVCCDKLDSGIKCKHGRVIEINWSEKLLTGTFDSSIGSLSHLKSINLSGNKLNGIIPPEISNLTKLQFLYLQNNKFEGDIPQLHLLQRLKIINLSFNRLTGLFTNPINQPPYYGSLSSCSIQAGNFLQFNENNTIPELCGGNESFYPQYTPLSDCQIYYESWLTAGGDLDSAPDSYTCCDTLDPRLTCNHNRIDGLYWSKSGLNGLLDPRLGNLTYLKVMSFDGNELTGPIPQTFTNLNNLVYLNLEGNKLNGELPNLSTLPYLEYLLLKWNELSGLFVNSVSNLGYSELKSCQVFNNDFCSNSENSIPVVCNSKWFSNCNGSSISEMNMINEHSSFSISYSTIPLVSTIGMGSEDKSGFITGDTPIPQATSSDSDEPSGSPESVVSSITIASIAQETSNDNTHIHTLLVTSTDKTNLPKTTKSVMVFSKATANSIWTSVLLALSLQLIFCL